MTARKPFPEAQPGISYLTEGGSETEIMYGHGFDFPEFAMFTLLDQPAAMVRVRAMYESYLDTAARHGFAVLMGGLDYRASPGWAARVGFSGERLRDVQLRCLDFLRTMAKPYVSQLPAVKITGLIGPRGDAYTADTTITAEESEDYHSEQIATLASAEVDLVQALTFNNVPEAVGVARAAARHGLSASVSFILDGPERLAAGPTLREAIEAVDELTGDERPAFYGVNCVHPDEFASALEDAEWFKRVRCLRPNAVMADKVALCSLGHLEAGDPVALGATMGALARQHPHLDIWGGCCGTWDAHLDEIARSVGEARRLVD
jgi:S-methylmethionine-dependent homocysteine/selenocysteine methylase